MMKELIRLTARAFDSNDASGAIYPPSTSHEFDSLAMNLLALFNRGPTSLSQRNNSRRHAAHTFLCASRRRH